MHCPGPDFTEKGKVTGKYQAVKTPRCCHPARGALLSTAASGSWGIIREWARLEGEGSVPGAGLQACGNKEFTATSSGVWNHSCLFLQLHLKDSSEHAGGRRGRPRKETLKFQKKIIRIIPDKVHRSTLELLRTGCAQVHWIYKQQQVFFPRIN